MKMMYVVLYLLVISLIGCAKESEPIQESPADVLSAESPPPFPGETNIAITEVDLTADKRMEPDEIQIKPGATIRWNNKDSNYYHNLIIYFAEIERPTQKDVIVQSGNIAPGEYWEYEFDEKGEYIIKDIYSGTMRGKITGDTTKKTILELLNEGKIGGTISVK